MAPRTINKGFMQAATPKTFGFPNAVQAVLRYHDRSAQNPTITSTSVRVFRLNGMYDPDTAAGGHQPRGYDEYTAIYQHYQVKACKFKINFMTDNSVPMMVGWAIRRSSTAEEFNDYIEGGDCKWDNLGQSTGMDTQMLSGTVNVAKWLGVSESNDRLESPFSANPDEQLYLHVWVTGDSISEPGSVTSDTVLDYTAYMREKKILTQS